MDKNFAKGFIAGVASAFVLVFLALPFVEDRVMQRVIEHMTIPEFEEDTTVGGEQLKQTPAFLKPIPRRKPLEMKMLAEPRQFSQQEKYCLAKNIFHEAGVEPWDGKIAVGQVTMNRLDSGRWGDDVCKVVYAKAQFSWTLSKEKRKEVPKGPLWEESKKAAAAVIKGERHFELTPSLFYHTDYINQPKWAGDEYKIAQIGQHIFYTQDRKK